MITGILFYWHLVFSSLECFTEVKLPSWNCYTTHVLNLFKLTACIWYIQKNFSVPHSSWEQCLYTSKGDNFHWHKYRCFPYVQLQSLSTGRARIDLIGSCNKTELGRMTTKSCSLFCISQGCLQTICRELKIFIGYVALGHY